MTIKEFRNEVAYVEGMKVEVNIAQISEILKVVNKLTGGTLYKTIKQL